ncbi:MAG: hypothetical protein COA33_005530 [Fluviicola sp.]|nr:hypothetical protein [Fluviicola sp.]
MNKTLFAIALSAFMLIGFTSMAQHKKNHKAQAVSQAGHVWVKLGTRIVDYKLDRDVIHVGAKEGSFTKLKIEVRGGAINMHKMVVTYMNGTKETIALKHRFNKASGSRVIDIRGGKRLIKHITMFYDTKNLARSKAVVHVLGRR